jgi:lipoprotein-anchoring transpeptidase ErfK/SrfK
MYTQPNPQQQPPPSTRHMPPAHLPQRRKSARKIPYLLIAAFVGFGGLVIVALISIFVLVALAPERIPSGVSVAGLDIGGEKIEDATQYLSQNLPESSIMMIDGTREFPMSYADLGVSINVTATIERAQEARRNADVDFYYSVDLNQTQIGLVFLSERMNIPATVEREGSVMDIPIMLDRFRLNPESELSDNAVEVAMLPTERLNPASINRSATARTTHIVQPGQELALIAREYGVAVDDILEFNNIDNPDLIYSGQELIIPADGEYQVAPENAPSAPTNSGKAIVVSTDDQRIYAYENGQLVHSHLVSTGRQLTPTVRGDYNIYVKYEATDMRGADYYLPNVPYTMYFYQGYGIHGTYWHNSFGRPMSHGCVNLPIEEAQWFFNWANVGTIVRVI